MTPRDPVALQGLQQAVQPALQSLVQAASLRRRRLAFAAVLQWLPRACLWLAALTVLAGLVVAVPVWLPLVTALVLGACCWLLQWSQLPAVQPALAAAAHAIDRAHGNADRLTAACEFAAEEPPVAAAEVGKPELAEGLRRLAIADGIASLQRIDARRAELPAAPAPTSTRRLLLALGLLAVLPWLLPRGLADRPAAVTTAQAPLVAGAGDAARRPAVDGKPAPAAVPLSPPAEEARENTPSKAPTPGEPPPPRQQEPVPAVPAASGRGQAGSDAASESAASGAPKAAPVGNPGSGQSGGGQGASAGGAPDPQPTPPSQQQPAKPKAAQPTRPQPEQDGKPSESAGAPSGPSRGSGRMSAVANKRSDLNRGQERDDDPEIEDEPLADENDEQEQRGGVMPMRRGDQRPPARELSISGDGPPDQGRGGPTPPKKSRGTASLVLGMRLPDSVRGQPNPGTAKTTLEQIPPRPSEVAPGLALPPPAGRSSTPQSQRPTARFPELLHQYHELLRAAESKPLSRSAAATSAPTEEIR